MRLLDIVKTIGATALNVALPGAGTALLATVNTFMPSDNQLPPTATGYEIENAIHSMPPESKAALIEKQFDVDITQIKESHSTVRTMLESDAKNPHTTRPWIAQQAFKVVGFTIVSVISLWCYAVASGDTEMVKEIVGGWQFILAVIGPFVTLLWAYFGILKTENKNRLNAASGNSAGGAIGSIITSMVDKLSRGK